MIADLKLAGVNAVRRTVRRYVIRYVLGGLLLIVGVGYKAVTGRDLYEEPEPEMPAVSAAAVAPAAPAPTAGATPAANVAAASATPQGIPDINAPKRAAQNAVDASNAQLSAQTGQAVPDRGAASAPRSGPGSVPATPVAPSDTDASVAIGGSTGSPLNAQVTRESFNYGNVGRRDPFFSLILTDDLRPLLADLRLVGILYEASGRRTVAIMRDLQTNAQYRVTNGMALGRMRVSQIRPRAVIFSIDEFGLSRQDSLVWSDTTKVRN